MFFIIVQPTAENAEAAEILLRKIPFLKIYGKIYINIVFI